MKAIRITHTGDASVLSYQEVPIPVPGKGEALVKLKAAGLNFIDIYIRTGRYARPLPFIPGLEGAGIVESIGEEVTEVKVGDRVAYTGTMGSYAEFNVVKASDLILLPKELSFEQGAAFPLQGMTAHYLIHEYYPIKKGTKVLVHAAAGGVGLLLVQWLNHLGATVIGTVSTPEKANIAKAAGAHYVINYNEEDFVAKAQEYTQGIGPDYIIDGVGKSTFTKNLDAIRMQGHICLFGSASGPADPLLPNSLQAKCLTISGGSLFYFMSTRTQLVQRANAVINGIREGWLKLRIDHVFALNEAADAQRMLEGRKTVGKVILKIGE
ncbi:MAG: quinone oxidoreductase [Proteobacteria bacterium]|nr:quinone oxidoreductase [Pseudomonadota bacterium]